MKYTVEQVYQQIGKVTHEHHRLAKMAEDLVLDNLQLQQASRWIPVEEISKGHNAHRVQILMKNNYVVIATYYRDDDNSDEHFINDSGDYIDFSDVISFKEITLPTPEGE